MNNNTSESTRQQKVASQVQQDLSDMFLKEAAGLIYGSMVTISKVRMSPDLALAKVYISVFPFANGVEIIKKLKENVPFLRHSLGKRVRNQLRIVPEIAFFIDDSLEHIEQIDRLIKL